MASIFDAARYILEQRGRMSTMKLHKLLYYAQAWSLAWDEVPLFGEDFEAWVNGPVCKILYKKYKGRFDLYPEDVTLGDSSKLSEDQKEVIDLVLGHYGSYDAQFLSQLTHIEAPWKDARAGYAPREKCHIIIHKDSMARYYSGLLEESPAEEAATSAEGS